MASHPPGPGTAGMGAIDACDARHGGKDEIGLRDSTNTTGTRALTLQSQHGTNTVPNTKVKKINLK